MSNVERRTPARTPFPIRRWTFDVRHSTFVLLSVPHPTVLLRILHRPAALAAPHREMPPHVAQVAQRHHVERIAVVGVVHLHLRAPAVDAPLLHVQQAQLPEPPRDLPDDLPSWVELLAPPLAFARTGAAALPLFSGAAPLAVGLVAFPGSRSASGAVGRILLPLPRAVLLDVLRTPAPAPCAITRLARCPASPSGVPQVELHQVLLLPARRAHLRQRMVGVGNPVHAMSLLGRRVSRAAPGRPVGVLLSRESGSGCQVPGSGRPPSRSPSAVATGRRLVGVCPGDRLVPGPRFQVPAEPRRGSLLFSDPPRNPEPGTRNRSPPPPLIP